MPYSEFFGGDHYFLEIYFKSNPRGLLRSPGSGPLGFDAYFVTDGREERVSGMVTGTGDDRRYTFHVKDQAFHGKLERHPGKCEPKLRFTLEENKKVIDSGDLQGAFCS